MRLHAFILVLLLVVCFTLGAGLQPWFATWAASRTDATGMIHEWLGESRQLMATQFFVKADEYFHGGYYPSVFDQAEAPKTLHIAETDHNHHDHEDMPDFLGPAQDWISRFGRHFYPTEHLHIQGAGEREILPWLELSAALDPHKVQTYTTAAFWLRTQLGKVNEALQFLRQGLRANPDSSDILFELGSIYYENRHAPGQARNIWELALRRWHQVEAGKPEPNQLLLEQILANLARLEEREGQLDKALDYLQQLKKVSPVPGAIEQQIQDLRKKGNIRP
jgi:tetratricopeptide (TPR) repeat protein